MLDARSIALLHIRVMDHEYTPDTVPDEIKKAEGVKLKQLWDANKPMSQAAFAVDVLGRSAGYLPQFFSGQRPVSLQFARIFAEHLKCGIEEFSPRLAKEAATEKAKVVWPFPEVDYEQVKNLEDWDLIELQGKIRGFLLKKKSVVSALRGRRSTAVKRRGQAAN